MAIPVLIYSISKAIGNKEYVIGLFVDFTKAFDTVNHTVLLRKVSHYGLRGNTFQWIHDYLNNK